MLEFKYFFWIKKTFIITLFLIISSAFTVFGQEKPRLGILPFAGGEGEDGDIIATLFSIQDDIRGTFTVVPRTAAVNALLARRSFQMSGYTDSDNIASIGKMLNVDFVISGYIRRLGDQNLVIATIVNVQTFEQLGGEYRGYRDIGEIRDILPDLSKRIITAFKRDTSGLPSLAITPFQSADKTVNKQDAETLVQILSVEIANTGAYAVLPRATTMRAALKELEFKMPGYTAEEGAKALGKAINARYVLSVQASSQGNINMFITQILNVEDGSQLFGESRDYRIVDDGIKLMPELALNLTGRTKAEAQTTAQTEARNNGRSKFWSVGISAGTTFSAPWVIGTVHGTIAPIKNLFFELGFDYGMISRVEDVEQYYSMYPFIHASFFVPFKKSGGWYAGVGGGYMFGKYTFPEEDIPLSIFAFDVTSGVNIGNILDVSYTLRTTFKTVNHKVAVGYTYRFK